MSSTATYDNMDFGSNAPEYHPGQNDSNWEMFYLHGEINGLNGQVTTLSEENIRLLEENSDLEMELANAESENKDLKKAINVRNKTIKEKDEQIERLKQTIFTLTNELSQEASRNEQRSRPNGRQQKQSVSFAVDHQGQRVNVSSGYARSSSVPRDRTYSAPKPSGKIQGKSSLSEDAKPFVPSFNSTQLNFDSSVNLTATNVPVAPVVCFHSTGTSERPKVVNPPKPRRNITGKSNTHACVVKKLVMSDSSNEEVPQVQQGDQFASELFSVKTKNDSDKDLDCSKTKKLFVSNTKASETKVESEPKATVVKARTKPQATVDEARTEPKATEPQATVVKAPAKQEATVVKAPAKPQATVVKAPAKPQATVVKAPAKPQATVVKAPAKQEATSATQQTDPSALSFADRIALFNKK